MNTDLKSFMVSYLRVVLGTLMPIALIAFLSITYSLGGHPGEPISTATYSAMHMT